jgi:hypothetical protein
LERVAAPVGSSEREAVGATGVAAGVPAVLVEESMMGRADQREVGRLRGTTGGGADEVMRVEGAGAFTAGKAAMPIPVS